MSKEILSFLLIVLFSNIAHGVNLPSPGSEIKWVCKESDGAKKFKKTVYVDKFLGCVKDQCYSVKKNTVDPNEVSYLKHEKRPWILGSFTYIADGQTIYQFVKGNLFEKLDDLKPGFSFLSEVLRVRESRVGPGTQARFSTEVKVLEGKKINTALGVRKVFPVYIERTDKGKKQGRVRKSYQLYDVELGVPLFERNSYGKWSSVCSVASRKMGEVSQGELNEAIMIFLSKSKKNSMASHR